MKVPLRWGIAGAGMISHDFVTAVATLPVSDHKVVAVAGNNLEKVQDFATMHSIKNAYKGYETLGSDHDIDIVYVGVPNPEHFQVAKMMLQHNKHVLCEKPLCMNSKEVKELIELATEKKLFLLEGMWSRFFPAYEALDKHIQSGGLGDILQVSVQFGVPIEEKEKSAMKTLGGGAVLDLGVYCLQFAQLIFRSDPEKVLCEGHVGDEGVDESMTCVLSYPGGRKAIVSTDSRVLLSNDAYITGTKGSMKIKDFWCPTMFQASVADITEWDLPQGNFRFYFYNSAGMCYEAEECRKCINEGLLESPKMTHSQSISLAKLEDEIRHKIGAVQN